MPAIRSRYAAHVARWSNCTRCPLHERRKKVVLARGTLPCDVLFIGEAPGQSEDVIGAPFVGPAGQLLDRVIESATPLDLRLAFTNLVCCIPKDETNTKINDPPQEAIDACDTRLGEILRIANPSTIVCVGTLSGKWVPKRYGQDEFDQIATILHPAAILRADAAQQGLMTQRTIVTLSDVFTETRDRLS